ncbi:MAG: hypothetical protein JWQ35_1668 [Bacteriovoracaceae bacterium]|nr:hypothetical protein [Bacteriovoracaceae bacterium]
MDALLLIAGPLLFVGGIQFIFGFFCLVKTKQRNLLTLFASVSAFIAAFYSCTIATSYIRASMSLDYSVYYRLGWMGWFIVPFSLQVVYQLRGNVGWTAKAVTWSFLLFWMVVNYLNLTTDLIDIEPSSFLPYIHHGGPFEIFCRQVGSVQILWAFYQIYRARKESVGHKRQQTAYLFLGTFLYALGGFIFSSAPLGRLYVDAGLTSYFGLPWIALTIYAVTRHRLFDIRVLVSGIISAFILISVFIGIDIAAFQGLKEIVGLDLAKTLSTVVTLMIVFATPVVSSIRRWINAIILRKSIDYQTALKKSSEALISILNLDDLLRKFIEITRHSLGVIDAGFYLLNGDKYELRYFLGHHSSEGSGGVKLEKTGALITWLQEKKRIFVREEEISEISKKQEFEFNSELAPTKGEAAVPVFF